VLLLCTQAVPCAAQEAEATAPEVIVDCPELDRDTQAKVQARQMSELVSQGVQSGTLRLVCSTDRVTGTWEEGGTVLDSRFLSRNEGEGAVELLHWLASVLLELRSEREGGGAPPSAGSAATGSVVAGGAAQPEASPTEEAATSPPTTDQTTEPPAPAVAAPAAAAPRAATKSAPEVLTFDASWLYSHFGTEIFGTTGPRLGLRLRVVERVTVGLLVDGRIGIYPSDGPSFGLIDVATGLSATYEFFPFLSASLAPLLVFSNFMAPSETSGPGSPVLAGGALLSVRGKVPLRDARPFLELGLHGAAPAHRVTLNGTPVLTVPAWQVQVAVGVEIPL